MSECAAGTYSPDGISQCLQCPDGTYTATSPYATCTVCPAGSACPDTTAGKL